MLALPGPMALRAPAPAPLAAMPPAGAVVAGPYGLHPMLIAAIAPTPSSGGGAGRTQGPEAEAEPEPDAAPPTPAPAPGGDAGLPAARSLEEDSERLAADVAKMENLDKLTTLSKEQIAAITAAAARISHEFDARMREQMKGLGQQIAAAQAMQWKLSQQDMAKIDAELSATASRIHPSPKDIADLEAQLRRLSDRSMRPSDADIKKIEAEVKRELKRLPDLGISPADAARIRKDVDRVVKESIAAMPPVLSDAQRDHLLAEAHRLADQARPDAAQLDALRDLQRRHQDLTRLIDQQRRELDNLRSEIDEESRSLRDLARRESEAHRTHSPRPSPDARPKAAPASPAAPPAPASPASPAAPPAPPAPAPDAPPRSR